MNQNNEQCQSCDNLIYLSGSCKRRVTIKDAECRYVKRKEFETRQKGKKSEKESWNEYK